MFSGRKCKTGLAILDKLWYYIRAKRTPVSYTHLLLRYAQNYVMAGVSQRTMYDLRQAVAVSYTHLDVYKRQAQMFAGLAEYLGEEDTRKLMEIMERVSGYLDQQIESSPKNNCSGRGRRSQQAESREE